MVFDTAGGHKHPPVSPVPTVLPEPTHFHSIGHNGERALWVGFALMVVSTIIFAGLSWNIPVSRRVYHVLTTIATLISALAYFGLATGQATAYNCNSIRDTHKHVPDTFHDECRQVLWGHWVDWALTTPLLLIQLGFLAVADGAHIVMSVAAGLVVVFGGLFSAFGHYHTAQKWGWFAISVIGLVFVIWHVTIMGARSARAAGNSVGKLYGALAGFFTLLWVAYLVVWGLAPAAQRIKPGAEVIAYLVLNFLAKPVFGFWLLTVHRQNPETSLDVGGWWSHGANSEGRIRITDEEAA